MGHFNYFMQQVTLGPKFCVIVGFHSCLPFYKKISRKNIVFILHLGCHLFKQKDLKKKTNTW